MGAQKINYGENPANWMLRVLSTPEVGNLAERYLLTNNFIELTQELDQLQKARNETDKIEYQNQFAATLAQRQTAVNKRLSLIYWRSPAYNYTRIVVSMVIAFVLGSVFITQRHPESFTESEMRARLAVIFLTFIITGIMAILAVIPVMTEIRDMYYRHRDAGMYGGSALGLALGVAEKWFILLSSTLFCVIFLFSSGLYVRSFTHHRRFSLLVGFWVGSQESFYIQCVQTF